MKTFARVEYWQGDARGVWWVPTDATILQLWHVLAVCPDCGLMMGIHHQIAADGSCHPSVVCPHEPCAFHDYVQLAGWNGGKVESLKGKEPVT